MIATAEPTAANYPHRIREFPSAGILFECVENANPDRGYSIRDGDFLRDEQIEDAFRIEHGPGKDQLCANHHGGERNAPGVRVEHGSDRQKRVGWLSAIESAMASDME